jgi:hypothetical protein
MKHVYSVFSKALLMASAFLLANQTQAQSSSTNAPGACGAVVANFNTTSGNHASPSIYGDLFDSAFYYHPVRGYWTDMDHDRMIPPQSPRNLTIISPPYVNPSAMGQFNVGFYYIVPNALTDRFQVRIIAVSPGPGGTTVSNLVASTGAQSFALWSSPHSYVDQGFGSSPANPFLVGDSGHVCIRILDADITNDPGTFYRVEIAYVLSNPAIDNRFAVYDNLSIGATVGQGPLPVSFMGIVANRVDNGNGIQVKWDVGDEVNVDRYELQRSTTGGSFTTVGTIGAKHKSVYSFTDPNGKASVLYYRVRSVDADGSFKYSGIIKLTNNSSYSDVLKSYPSPARDMVTLQHGQLTTGATFTVTNMDGKVMKVVKPGSGNSNTMIDISNFATGTYIIRLNNGDGKVETTTIIKQ